MQGKICLVTGANSGIGKEVAIGLAKLGAKVLIICRHPERGEKALHDIKQQSGNNNVSLYIADLSSQLQIKQVTDQIKQDIKQLDVLINNAGILMRKRTLSDEGIESTLAINHLAYFLLTYHLIDLLKKSAPARIVCVASESQFKGKVEFDNLQGERRFNKYSLYNNSKLFNVLFTYELARKIEGSGVTINCLNPGAVNTGFGLEASFLFYLFSPLSRFFMANSKKGAETSFYLASSPEVENISGQYFEKCQAVPSAKISYDQSIAKKLWMASESLTNTHW